MSTDTELIPYSASVRDRTDRKPERTRLDAFPRDPVFRWLLRALFAVPYLVVTWAASYSSANAQLVTPN